MGTNEYSQPASKSSWVSQDFGDVKMVVKMAHFHKSSRPQWVKDPRICAIIKSFGDVKSQNDTLLWQSVVQVAHLTRISKPW